MTTVPVDASEVTIERALSLEALSRPVLESSEVAFVLRAESSLVEQCMQAQGYDFEFPAQQTELVEPPTLLTGIEMWARADVKRASEVGFGLRPHLDEVRRTQSSGGRVTETDSTGPIDLGSLSTEELALFDLAYFGAPSERVEIIERDGSVVSIAGGGCLGRARVELWGDLGNYLRLRDARSSMLTEPMNYAISNRDVQEALSEWRDCVAEEGFGGLTSPPDAVQLALDHATAGAEGWQTMEVDLAVADAECKLKSNLADRFLFAYISAAESLRAELEAQLIAYRELEQQVVDRALSSLGG